jgi:hypothetical protein
VNAVDAERLRGGGVAGIVVDEDRSSGAMS